MSWKEGRSGSERCDFLWKRGWKQQLHGYPLPASQSLSSPIFYPSILTFVVTNGLSLFKLEQEEWEERVPSYWWIEVNRYSFLQHSWSVSFFFLLCTLQLPLIYETLSLCRVKFWFIMLNVSWSRKMKENGFEGWIQRCVYLCWFQGMDDDLTELKMEEMRRREWKGIERKIEGESCTMRIFQ